MEKYQRKFREPETWSAAAQVDSENSLAFRNKQLSWRLRSRRFVGQTLIQFYSANFS